MTRKYIKRKVEVSSDIKLHDNECMIKVNSDNIGFLSYMNKSGAFPQGFEWWNGRSKTVGIIDNIPLEGWKLCEDARLGMSQSWIKVIHPYGFILETQLSTFIQLLQEITIENGNLKGTFFFDPRTKHLKLCT